MGIRAKMNFSIILLLLLMTVFFDLTVYQIYKQDIEAKEIASMGDANEILSDNIMNLIGSVEENLMSEIGRCGVFSYQASLSETVSASVERKMKGLATLMHFRGIDCRNIFIPGNRGRTRAAFSGQREYRMAELSGYARGNLYYKVLC